MATVSLQHDCSVCAFHKRTIEGITVDEDDKKVYQKIQIMKSNADQAVRGDSLSALGEDVDPETKAAYFEAALRRKDSAMLLEREWWLKMKDKYPIPDSAKFDESTNTFFECVDKDGNASIDGIFVPRTEPEK